MYIKRMLVPLPKAKIWKVHAFLSKVSSGLLINLPTVKIPGLPFSTLSQRKSLATFYYADYLMPQRKLSTWSISELFPPTDVLEL